ncbi:MAG: aspartate--tRNA ligase [bacterium]|nr:aspartate--tRNA ligase [bacterium]
MKRSLTKETINKEEQDVSVSGWVDTIRSHGKLIFIDLRDYSGILQVVFNAQKSEVYELAKKLRPEWVVEIQGTIKKRPDNLVNNNIETGKIELAANGLIVLSESGALPISIEKDGYEMDEEKRLKYRYLDLRRKRLQRNLKERHRVIKYMRDFLSERGFTEIETPILAKSTPEGAREFLVPSRFHKGKFFALAQSPQQYKQLLMVAGFEKYFQVARALRDEDPRADRQAEHTQLDIELSFYSQEEILELVENLYIDLVKNLFPEKKIKEIPFPRITYQEAAEKYQSDKPDLRSDKKDENELAFAFITDFPMFEWKEGDKRWGAMHHPFTKPQTDDVAEIKKDPSKILAFQYDAVLNGFEIGGGSIRNINADVLKEVFKVLGNKEKDIMEQFSHYFDAFGFGVPPHGGIALGIDRFLAILMNEPNIREVIAFPKTGDNKDLMIGIPSAVDKMQLKELGIEIRGRKNKK